MNVDEIADLLIDQERGTDETYDGIKVHRVERPDVDGWEFVVDRVQGPWAPVTAYEAAMLVRVFAGEEHDERSSK